MLEKLKDLQEVLINTANYFKKLYQIDKNRSNEKITERNQEEKKYWNG